MTVIARSESLDLLTQFATTASALGWDFEIQTFYGEPTNPYQFAAEEDTNSGAAPYTDLESFAPEGIVLSRC